jgi:hypothetical protein
MAVEFWWRAKQVKIVFDDVERALEDSRRVTKHELNGMKMEHNIKKKYLINISFYI